MLSVFKVLFFFSMSPPLYRRWQRKSPGRRIGTAAQPVFPNFLVVLLSGLIPEKSTALSFYLTNVSQA